MCIIYGSYFRTNFFKSSFNLRFNISRPIMASFSEFETTKEDKVSEWVNILMYVGFMEGRMCFNNSISEV